MIKYLIQQNFKTSNLNVPQLLQMRLHYNERKPMQQIANKSFAFTILWRTWLYTLIVIPCSKLAASQK